MARRLREYLRAEVPEGWTAHADGPHDILRTSAELGSNVAERAHQKLTRLEVEAVKTAERTPYAVGLIGRAKATGIRLAIVSNNTQTTVESYLSANGLSTSIDNVSTRPTPDPTLMKPNPYLVATAVYSLDADCESSALSRRSGLRHNRGASCRRYGCRLCQQKR